jgi:hypothetical protein
MSGILQGVVASISESEEYGAVGWTSSPYLTFFKKQGNRFIQLIDPATMPAAGVTKISWSRLGNFVAVRYDTNKVTVYSLSGDTVTHLYDRDYSGIAASYGDLRDIAWTREEINPSGTNWLSLIFPKGQFYELTSKIISTASVFNDYDALGLGDVKGIAFLLGYNSANGGSVLIRGTGAEYLFCVEQDGLGASPLPGRIVTQPSVVPVYVASRNSGTAFAVVTNAGSNNVIIYTRSGANWDIAHTLSVPGVPVRCAWSADGNLLGVTHDTSPYYSVVDFTGGSPTVVDGTTALAAAGNDITMSRDNFTAITATSVSDFLQMQRRNNGVWDLSSTADFSFTESDALAVSLKNNAYVGN